MNYEISIKLGNLLLEKDATFIVNTSNTTMILGSGVSMAFKRHCGLKLQDAMNTQLKHRGNINQGDVVKTLSYATNFKYALHCAVMDYNTNAKSKSPTLNTIKDILNNIDMELENYFQYFDEKVKIVLPLLGCGVGGLDKKDVIDIYKSHFSKDINFECEVVIYGYDNEDFEMIQNIMEHQ